MPEFKLHEGLIQAIKVKCFLKSSIMSDSDLIFVLHSQKLLSLFALLQKSQVGLSLVRELHNWPPNERRRV